MHTYTHTRIHVQRWNTNSFVSIFATYSKTWLQIYTTQNKTQINVNYPDDCDQNVHVCVCVFWNMAANMYHTKQKTWALSHRYTHIHIHKHLHTYTYTQAFTYIYIYIYIYTRTHAHIYGYTHTYTHAHIHTRMDITSLPIFVKYSKNWRQICTKQDPH